MTSVFDSTKSWLEANNFSFQAESIVGSTNDLAMNSNNEKSKIFIADEQTKGRGRGTRSWLHSKNGAALLISILYIPPSAPQAITAPLFGLAVFRALSRAWPNEAFSLKAPNDIYLAGNKCGGILIETIETSGKYKLVFGFGLNVFDSPHSKEFKCTHLTAHFPLTENEWSHFLSELISESRSASEKCLDTHLSDSDRQELLIALNKNPQLINKYNSVSPFADLSTNQGVISWREL